MLWRRRHRREKSGWALIQGGAPSAADLVARPWNEPGWLPSANEIEFETEVVCLSPDYSADLPLWGCNWWTLGLTVELLNALADWQEDFDRSFRHDTGWTDEAAANAWAHRGGELADALRNALPPTIALEVSLWPIENDNGS